MLKHIKKDAERRANSDSTGETKKKNLFAETDGDNDDSEDEDSVDSDSPLWLIMTTKKHVVDKNRLKPSKIAVPHSLNNSPNLRICLITADPQRAVKDAIADPVFPSQLASRITTVIGYSKLKAKYHTFESRRQLHAEHDIFLADERIVMRLIDSLGKIFYKSSKRPIPIHIAEVQKVNGKRVRKEDRKRPPTDEKYAAVAGPLVVARAIEKALESVPVQLAPSTTTAVRVGKVGFSADQVAENVRVVVEELTNRFVSRGWRNVKAIHLKGAKTMALPIWLASELWVGDEDIVEEDGGKENVEQKLPAAKKAKLDAPSKDTEAAKAEKKQKSDKGVSEKTGKSDEKKKSTKKKTATA